MHPPAPVRFTPYSRPEGPSQAGPMDDPRSPLFSSFSSHIGQFPAYDPPQVSSYPTQFALRGMPTDPAGSSTSFRSAGSLGSILASPVLGQQNLTGHQRGATDCGMELPTTVTRSSRPATDTRNGHPTTPTRPSRTAHCSTDPPFPAGTSNAFEAMASQANLDAAHRASAHDFLHNFPNDSALIALLVYQAQTRQLMCNRLDQLNVQSGTSSPNSSTSAKDLTWVAGDELKARIKEHAVQLIRDPTLSAYTATQGPNKDILKNSYEAAVRNMLHKESATWIKEHLPPKSHGRVSPKHNGILTTTIKNILKAVRETMHNLLLAPTKDLTRLGSTVTPIPTLKQLFTKVCNFPGSSASGSHDPIKFTIPDKARHALLRMTAMYLKHTEGQDSTKIWEVVDRQISELHAGGAGYTETFSKMVVQRDGELFDGVKTWAMLRESNTLFTLPTSEQVRAFMNAPPTA